VRSEGPWLLVYAAAVHGWSAWTERAWGWTASRIAGLAGAAAVAVAWGQAQPWGDTAIHAALHLFALAVMLPELVAVWRGRGVLLPIGIAVLVGVGLLDASLLLSEMLRAYSSALRGGGLVAGALWLGLAALLAGRSQERSAATFVRGLGGLGGVVLAIGAAFVWDVDWRGAPWGPVASLAVLAPLLLLLRRRVNAGDAGVVAAAILCFLLARAEVGDLIFSHARTIVAEAPSTFALLVLALVPAATLTAWGRNGFLRGTGLVLGAAALSFPFVPPHEEAMAWGALGLALPALWALGGHERARATGDLALAWAARAMALVLAVTWAGSVTTLARVSGWPNALDPHTVSALTLAIVLVTIRLRPVPGAKPSAFRDLLMAGAVGLLLLAGGREVHLLTLGFPASEHSAALALFGAAAALALALHARTGERLGRAATAIACLFAAALFVLSMALSGATGTPLVLALLGVGLACGLVTEVLLRRRGERPTWLGAASVPLLVLGLAWFSAAQMALRPPVTALANDRFLAGAGLTLLLAGTLWSTIRAGGPTAARWATGIGLLVVGYLAGLFELVLATRPLHGAWSPVLVSLYTAAVAAAMLVVGFRWSLRPLRVAALVVLGIVVAKVGLYDLAASELPLRVLVTGVLGLVLLGSAYAYARTKRATTPED
jgi:hypothetical protein